MDTSVPQAVANFEAAIRLVEAATAHAASRGWAVAVAVVDPSGMLTAFGRMNGVAPPVGDFAADKAYTAATLRRSTLAFFERMSGSPSLAMGVPNRPRLMTWEGGLPIFEGGTVIGGIGVSGAAGHEDADCASVALARLGLSEIAGGAA